MSWPTVKLDTLKADVRYSCVGGPFGSNLTSKDYVEQGVPVIRGQNLSGTGWFNEADFVYVSQDKANKLRPNQAFRGDLIFTQRGTLGQVGLIPANSKFDCYVVSQSQMKLTVDPAKVEARFLYFYFRLATTIEQILNRTITAGVPHINLGILKDFDIPLPPLAVQTAIADFGQAYDDLIETNRRRIALLEESARLLYREWFVDLRFPGKDGLGLNALPAGWDYACLQDGFVLQRGFDLPASNRAGGTTPIYASTGVAGYHNEAKVQGPGIITGRSGTLGQVQYVTGPFWPLNTTLWVKEFKKVPPLVAYFMLKDLNLAQFNAGASVPSLDRKVVHSIRIVIPAAQVMADFCQRVTIIFEFIQTLQQQNAQLTQARAELLPKLMSGELRL